MLALKVTTVGNSAGVVLPKEVMARMHLSKGDTIYLVETADGYRITPYNEQFQDQMGTAERIMREDRDVLRALAK